MNSKNFSSKDIRKNKKIKKMLQPLFIEEYCPKYKDIRAFNQPIDDELSQVIEKDLNRQPNLFIQDKLSKADTINVVNNMHKTIKESKLLSSHLCTYLQETYQLSLGQANYIAISSTQGGIGGCYPSNIISKIGPEIQYMINRQVLLSKIIIHQDKSVQYVGGQVIVFDTSQSEMSELLAQGCGVENHLIKESNDHIILYVAVNLGVLGQNLTKHPKIDINVAGTGTYGQKFLAELNQIKTKKELDDIGYEDIVTYYEELYRDTIYDDAQHTQGYTALADKALWVDVPLHTYPVNELDKNNIGSEFSVSIECMTSNQLLLAVQDEDHFVNHKFSNISLEDICTIAMDTTYQESNIKSVPSCLSSFWNKIKLSNSRQSTFYIDLDSNNGQRPTTDNHDTLTSLKQLFLIVKGILNYTLTSDHIKKLQRILIHDQNNKIKDEFISKLCAELDKNQLHKLNCLIAQTMNELVSAEDDTCFLRNSDDKIWSKLLFAEAKHCGMKIELSCSKLHQELVVPEIPREILQLYKILTNTFYNQENRKSDQSVAEKVAKSIHWLFINPLIIENAQIDWDVHSNLLKVPGEYTKLLINSNILSMIVNLDVDDIVLPNHAKALQQLNNIMSVFKESIIDILTDILKEDTIKALDMVISQEMITDTIRPYFDTKTVSYLLNNTQQIINDSISFLDTVYSKDPARIMLKLLSLNNQDDLVAQQDISKQVACKSYHEFVVPQGTKKITTVYITSFLYIVPMSEDLLVYNQDIEGMSLVGTTLSTKEVFF